MPRGKKRGPEVIDLTGDFPEPAKRPAISSAPNGFGYQPVYSSAGQSVPSSYPYQNFEQAQPNLSSSRTLPNSQWEPDALDLTQEEDGPQRELYNSLDGKIVGVRYYNGYASPGEFVLCRREPTNQYDQNAIRVDNVLGQQIGHLPRKVVEKLAPYIDSGDITVEAQLTGEKGFYDCPVRLEFYGPSDTAERNRIEDALKNDKLAKATQLKKTKKEAEDRRRALGLRNGRSTVGLGEANGVELPPEVSLESLLQNSESVELRKSGDAVKTLAMDESQLEKMPMAAQPSELRSTLLPYQLQGLEWMRSKEHPKLPGSGSDDMTQLWRRKPNGRFWNVATDFVTSKAPELLSGGILADDMGLGKTLQIISLILTGGPGTTLIIAPVSVMSNWEQQIQRHVKPEHCPRIIIYHGGKKMGARELLGYDVVITSYGKLSHDTSSDISLCSPKHKWRRVVLDEGHIIRNAQTKVAASACQLHAQSRWVLTGTPIINSVKDLHSIVKFLRITGGIEQSEIFYSVITRRLGYEDHVAETLLQALMQDLCLRRRKDMEFVDLKLPEKKEFVHRITFRPDEQRKYDGLLYEARGALEEYQKKSNSTHKGRFQGVLERLLRLRQICNHWALCKERIEDLMKLLEDVDVVELNEKNRALLQEALRLYIENQEECAICYQVPTAAVITHCKHVFCRTCITTAISHDPRCPMCRNVLSEDKLLDPPPEGIDDENFDSETQSSKTEAMVQIVKASIKNPGSKVIVFSQWTSFLNIVQNQLNVAGVKFARIDGSMRADKRDEAISALDNDPDTKVLLASLAVCSVGLNLVSADTVILSDSWWAPAIEDQAVDRVHRLGQARETTVWRLVMENSVEERVLDIQKDKRQLVNKAFREKNAKKPKEAKETRMTDVLKLLS